MKKWLALLLAILMVVTLAACTKKTENNPTNTTPDEQTKEDEKPNPYRLVDELVYTKIKDAKLYKEDNFTTVSVTIAAAATELHRIQVSDELKVSKVEYKGENYFVESKNLTVEDLYGKSYKAAEKTMYAKENNLKVYACASEEFGEVKVTLSKNDEVKVVAEGNGWSKIEYSKGSLSGTFFVKTSKLSAEQEVDYSKLDFSEYFTRVAGVEKKALVNVNLRIAPVVATATLANGLSLEKGKTYTIVGYGKGAYASWGIVHYPDTVKEGDTPTYTDYYVKLCAEDCTEVYIEVPQAALNNQIAKLGFTKGEETLYVKLQQLNLRYEPSLAAAYAGVREKGKAVLVVASGYKTEADPNKPTENVTIPWAMVKVDLEGGGSVYLYASKNGLSESGNTGAPTLAEILNKYSVLSIVEGNTIIKVAASSGVNCKTGLDNSLDSGVHLDQNVQVKLRAKGNYKGTEWYVFEAEGDAIYCAGAELFEIVSVSGPELQVEENTEEG